MEEFSTILQRHVSRGVGSNVQASGSTAAMHGA
jgi:hypothetical protein